MGIWLIAEDEGDLLSLVTMMAQAWGHVPLSFETGSKVMSWLDRLETGEFSGPLPDFALLDIRMPGSNGTEIAKRIRGMPRLRHIPIVFMTAFVYSDEEVPRVLHQTGANHLIHKPFFDFEKLRNLLHDVIAKHKNQPSEIPQNIIVEAAAATDQEQTANPGTEKIILVVEDEKDIRETIAFTLTMAGYKTIEAANGEQALEILESVSPSLVLADVRMPRMTGYEMCRVIRQNPNWRHIPVMFLSAKGQDDEVDTGLNAGAIRYMLKPFTPDELTRQVGDVIGHYRPVARIQDDKTHIAFFADEAEDRRSHAAAAMLENLPQKNYQPVVFSKEHFRHKIAEFPPDIIVLSLADIPTFASNLRQFALSKPIPLLAFGDSMHSLDDDASYQLYLSGVDDIFEESLSPDNLFRAVARLEAQYSQPALVELGEAWLVLIASTDQDFCSRLQRSLEGSFLVEVVIASTRETYQTQLQTQSFDLIFADHDWLNSQDEKIPVVTIITNHRDKHHVKTRTYLSRDYKPEHFQMLIERLTRKRQTYETLDDTWAQYALSAAETKYEAHLRDIAPNLAAMTAEIGSLYSGLIHDLRNAFYALSTQLTMSRRRLQDDGASLGKIEVLEQRLDEIRFLFEMIASCRFRSTWSPTKNDNLGFIEQAIRLAKAFAPSIDFSVNTLPTTSPALMVDKQQIVYALAGLLIALAEIPRVTDVTITADVGSANWLNLTLEVPPKVNLALYFDLENSEKQSRYSLMMISAIKIIQRHHGRFTTKENTTSIVLPVYPGNDNVMRVQIASFADEAEKLRQELQAEPDLPQGVDVNPLIHQSAILLTLRANELVEQSEKLDQPRLTMTARFARLLCFNMLTTSAGYKPSPAAIAVAPIFDTLVELRKDYLRDCDVSILVAEETPMVLADDLGLLQILVNLVNNAVEAMEGEGKLTISAAPHREGVAIRVANNGPAIPAAIQKKIFDLFFSTKQGHERGVGLHIVSSVVRELRGRIELESVEGGETTFTIILPAAKPDQG